MKSIYFSAVTAIFFTLIFTVIVLSQNNNSDENRQRIVSNSSSKTTLNINDLERKVLSLINNIRRTNGLQELTWNDQVAGIARTHSTNMAEKTFFSHRGFDGLMVDDRADAAGLGRWRAIGENIAFNRGYSKPSDFAVECWMKSQSHRENLLNPRWKETGIGIAEADDGAFYFTQVFLQRK